MILADYFSNVSADRHQANEVIPISFINLCWPDDLTMFGMMTRQRAQAAGVRVPKVHGMDKGVDPHVKPKHQKPHPQPEQKGCPPTAPSMPKKPHLPQAHPQAHDQCLSYKLVDRSRSILKQCELTNRLPCDKPPASNLPL